MSSVAEDHPGLPVEQVFQAARHWKESFNKPMKLGVRKATAVITCMDSRLMPASMFGFELGDAEYIRNAGGRITEDVMRSWVVCQELLHCKQILLVHHTDCGAQAAHTHTHDLMHQIRERFKEVKLTDKAKMVKEMFTSLKPSKLQTIPPTRQDLEKSVVDDVRKLRDDPLVRPHIRIYGFVYDVMDGSLTEITRDEGHQE